MSILIPYFEKFITFRGVGGQGLKNNYWQRHKIPTNLCLYQQKCVKKGDFRLEKSFKYDQIPLNRQKKKKRNNNKIKTKNKSYVIRNIMQLVQYFVRTKAMWYRELQLSQCRQHKNVLFLK